MEQQQEKFTLFYEAADCFSNWFMCNFKDGDNVEFNCGEQAMMYYKAKFFEDDETAKKVLNEKDPKKQKALGRLVKNFDEGKWNVVCRHIVYRVCYYKYKQNPKLMEELVATQGTTLVEASDSDLIWGVGLGKTDPLIWDRKNWRGKNWLGQVQTLVRDNFIARDSMLWHYDIWQVVGMKFN